MAFLNPDQIDKIQDALTSRDKLACMVAIGLITSAKDARAAPNLRAEAERIHASDDIEIDDVAGTSVADNGTWVQAWVWVPSNIPDSLDGEDLETLSEECLTERADHLAQLEQPGAVDLGVDDNATDQDTLFAELAAIRAELATRTAT